MASLSGVRIWLSGSVPTEISEGEKTRIVRFSQTLAREVFRGGGRVVHGCHPSLTPSLLETAREYREATGQRAPLSVLASAAYREPGGGYAGVALEALRQDSDFQEIPLVADRETDRTRSLVRLRDSLAAQADVLVAIGGKWWNEAQERAGVPAEFNLAITRGIPSFLLGGLGGATAGYLKQHREILRRVRNGLDEAANVAMAGESDVDALVKQVLEQMARLPLGRRETAEGQPFRILCLDGGGIRGVFTASVLAKWESMTGHRAADHFDLIAGTSTGGILALGLGLGLTAQAIVDFYRSEGPHIFPMTSLAKRSWRGFRHWMGAKFDASELEQRLSVAYGKSTLGQKLGDSPNRLLITSYNLTSDDLGFYRTSHHPSVAGHDHLPAVTVARATSAAPSYFNVARVDDPNVPHEAVDGGVWANCPALAALGEAVDVLRIPLDRIEMLSVGTTGTPSLIGKPTVATGKLGWASRAPDLLMKAQMQAVLCQVEQLLGKRFLRVDDAAATNGLDDLGSMDMLVNKGAKVAEANYDAVVSRFINGVMAARWRP